MKVIRDINDFPILDNVVVTNGTFDGCHIGHQKILEQLKNSAKAINGKSVVRTYWPHPRIVLGKENDGFKLLYTIEERIELLSTYDIDYLVILEFTPAFAQQSSHEFIQNIITVFCCQFLHGRHFQKMTKKIGEQGEKGGGRALSRLVFLPW